MQGSRFTLALGVNTLIDQIINAVACVLVENPEFYNENPDARRELVRDYVRIFGEGSGEYSILAAAVLTIESMVSAMLCGRLAAPH